MTTNDEEDKFSKLNEIFMQYHDEYEDIIAKCDPDAFNLFYDMHHNSFDYETLKRRFIELLRKYGDLLKKCHEMAFLELEAIVNRILD